MKNNKSIIVTFILIQVIIGLYSCTKNLTEINDPPIEPPGNAVSYPFIDRNPVWSPDGKIILYHHAGIIEIKDGGSYTVDSDSMGLWIINPDGTNPRLQIQGGYSAAWSPDGTWIAFEKGTHIYKAPFKNGRFDIEQTEQLTFEGRNYSPSISPDGEWIAYDSNYKSPNGMNFIWKMKSNGNQKERIAYDISNGEIRAPSWSQMGNKIVHIRYLIEAPGAEIFTMNSNGLDPTRITYNDYYDRFPEFSYDGRKIVFESDGNVLTMNSDGTNLKQLTVNVGLYPSWSPNGQKIAYVGSTTNDFIPPSNGTIYIMNADGSNKQQLTYGPK